MTSARPCVDAASIGRPVGARGLLIERAGLRIYFDPDGDPEGLPPADLICLSDVDPRSINERAALALSSPSTIIAGLAPCVSRFRMNQLPILHGGSRPALGVELTVTGEDSGRVRWKLRWPDLDVLHPAP